MSVYDINSKPTNPESLGFFSYWYLQWCLTTGLYMLEPWERKLFNTLAGLLVTFICFICVPFLLSVF
ncbi:hypothetical protein M3Y97_00439000 [Aphelenchoides bicaudatus]|nr:hypothetical protein M3Y97_00439000 [Aphelenchoides bicaudatus]